MQDIIDCEYGLQYNVGRMAVMAGALQLVKDPSSTLRSTLLDGRASVGYWTAGRSGAQVQGDERKSAVDRYNAVYKPALDAMNAAAERNEQVAAPKAANKGPKRVT